MCVLVCVCVCVCVRVRVCCVYPSFECSYECSAKENHCSPLYCVLCTSKGWLAHHTAELHIAICQSECALQLTVLGLPAGDGWKMDVMKGFINITATWEERPRMV